MTDRVTEVRNRLALGEDPVVATHESICIEGLGFIAVATRLGMTIDEETARCPSWALLPECLLPEDIFADLERDFGL